MVVRTVLIRMVALRIVITTKAAYESYVHKGRAFMEQHFWNEKPSLSLSEAQD